MGSDPVTIVVGGQSEVAYLDALMPQLHPWANLREFGVEIVGAQGDSGIPTIVEELARDGRPVLVLLDRDALQRAHEQAKVIQRDNVEPFELQSDLETCFDEEIIQPALGVLGYSAKIECLRQACLAPRTFDAIAQCAVPIEEPKAFGKVELARAAAVVSAQSWYVPTEIFRAVIRVGQLSGVGPFSGRQAWIEDEAIQASGRLYACNHVSNSSIAFWDFDHHAPGAIELPDIFDGTVAVCRAGRRFIARKHVRHESAEPSETWIHVFDEDGGALKVSERFRVRGSVYELHADEDGNHMTLSVQEATKGKYAIKCLANGTQRVGAAPGHGLYTASVSPDRQLMALGRPRFEVLRKTCREGSTQLSVRTTVKHRHLEARSYRWSPNSRYLAFFGRRWGTQKIKSQDCLWVLDLRTERVHRLAFGDRFIPVYWS